MNDHAADRLPPQDAAAERAVLGSMLRNNRVISDVAPLLRGEDFYHDAHQRIYAAILAVHGQNGKPVDLVILADRLHADGRIDDVGGYGFLADLLDAAPTAANVLHYAGIVRDKAVLRALLAVGQEIALSAAAQAAPPADLLERAEAAVLRIARMGQTGHARLIGPAVDRVLDGMDQRRSVLSAGGDSRLPGLSTGLADLDTLTGGLTGGRVMVVAARPGIGKSALAIALARSVTADNHNVLFCSLEMGEEEIAERLLAAEADVDSQIMRHGAATPEECDRLSSARQILYPRPLWVLDATRQSMMQIAGNARRLHARHGLSLVVVDYLQLVEPENRREPRQEQVACISRRLKELAKELHIFVVALSQLNRESEARQGGRPRLADLRESGAIEQDSDMVLLLHQSPEHPRILECIMAKNRQGPRGEFELVYDRRRHSFRDNDTPFAHEVPA